MNVLLPLVFILAAQPTPVSEEALSQALEVYSCHFDHVSDENYDGWPDGWTRRLNRKYPHYLKASIVKGAGVSRTVKLRKGKLPKGKPQADKPQIVENDGLRMQLDGGAIAIFSPPISISPLFSYILQGQIKTAGLKHNIAYYSVTFYDKDRKPLDTYYSEHYQQVANWEQITIGPLKPGHEQTRLAVIGLHLRPTEEPDLTGTATFDTVRLFRLPRMTLTANSPHNVFLKSEKIEITCRVSGVMERTPLLKLELIDIEGRTLDHFERRLKGKSIQDWHRERGYVEDELKDAVGKKHSGYYDTVNWSPQVDQNGFFRVRATMRGTNDNVMHQEMTLAIIHQQARTKGSEFGWSLPAGEDPLALKPLANLLTRVGINWVKYPVWFSKDDSVGAERLAEFAERISIQGITFVGVLDQPPKEARGNFGVSEKMSVATIFNEAELWRPVVEPVMTRLPLKVRWWQLGSDDDTSFVGSPDLESKIRQVKRELELFGQEIHLGLSWRWLFQAPQVSKPPWQFLSNTVAPAFTQNELENYLEGNRLEGAQLWLMLKPLSKKKYSVQTRAKDLVTRMLATRIKRADAAFIPNPFNTEFGLMNKDGTPGELLLPWRTTSLMLSGKKYVGSITLPGGSTNHIFAKGDDVVMVVWNDRPTKETIYLGESIQRTDVWGRVTKPGSEGHRQVVEVGQLPSFVTGLKLSIVQWRQKCGFDKLKLASIFGRKQLASIHFQNTFAQGVGGGITLKTPDVWETFPKDIPFKLANDQVISRPFSVLLRPDASTGRQHVQIDFEITADHSYKFSVYRFMQVGMGDMEVEMSTRLNEKGDLVIDQHITNNTNQFINFNCLLFAPDRRRKRIIVPNLGRGRNTKTYVLPRGEELIGKVIWLRVEEINGPRVMNYRIKVQP